MPFCTLFYKAAKASRRCTLDRGMVLHMAASRSLLTEALAWTFGRPRRLTLRRELFRSAGTKGGSCYTSSPCPLILDEQSTKSGEPSCCFAGGLSQGRRRRVPQRDIRAGYSAAHNRQVYRCTLSNAAHVYTRHITMTLWPALVRVRADTGRVSAELGRLLQRVSGELSTLAGSQVSCEKEVIRLFSCKIQRFRCIERRRLILLRCVA